MKNTEFIKLSTISSCWNGRDYVKCHSSQVIIRLSTITEVWEPYKSIVYPSYKEYKKKYEYKVPEDKCPTENVIKIAKSTTDGHGINGISTSLMIDEESYKRLLKALDVNF